MRAARQPPKALRRSLLVAQIAQASHAAPKLGGNIRPVTRKSCVAVVGSLEPDGRLKFLSAQNRSTRDAIILDIGSRKTNDACHYSDIDLHRPQELDGYAHKDGTPYTAK